MLHHPSGGHPRLMSTNYDQEAAHGWPPLVREQHGMISRAQLAQHGIDDHAIAHRLQQRRWQRVAHGVYAVHTGPLTRRAELAAAVLYGGTDVAISHGTAAVAWGIGSDTGPVHVTVPYSRSATRQPPSWGPAGALHPGIVVHRSRAFAHIVVEGDPPRTSAADTALDLAVAESAAPDAARVLVAVSTAARVRAEVLRRRLDARPPRKHATILRSTVDLLDRGVDSVLEHRYAVDVEAAHGLPAARRQSPVVVDSYTLYEDCDYSATGVGLIVRLDGRRYHSTPGIAFRDRRRDNAAELAGRPRLVYGWTDVSRDPCGVAREVETVLRREGWSGSTKGGVTCERCL